MASGDESGNASPPFRRAYRRAASRAQRRDASPNASVRAASPDAINPSNNAAIRAGPSGSSGNNNAIRRQ